MSQKKSTTKFNIHDRVGIINPSIVEYVGYPLTAHGVYKELNTPDNRQRVIDMLSDFEVGPGYNQLDVFNNTICSIEIKEILEKVAYYTVKARKFGGNQREIHRKYIPEFRNKEVTIIKKRQVKTGDSVSDKYGERPYLKNMKNHTLLLFTHDLSWRTDTEGTWCIQNAYWIEAKNVIKI